jgi:hypothetical protein
MGEARCHPGGHAWSYWRLFGPNWRKLPPVGRQSPHHERFAALSDTRADPHACRRGRCVPSGEWSLLVNIARGRRNAAWRGAADAHATFPARASHDNIGTSGHTADDVEQRTGVDCAANVGRNSPGVHGEDSDRGATTASVRKRTGPAADLGCRCHRRLCAGRRVSPPPQSHDPASRSQAGRAPKARGNRELECRLWPGTDRRGSLHAES